MVLASDQRQCRHLIRVCFALLATRLYFIRNDGSPHRSTPCHDTKINIFIIDSVKLYLVAEKYCIGT
jgi:hypothetical protein